MIKTNYETVHHLWEKTIDSYQLAQLNNNDYDKGIRNALKEANKLIEEHGWNKEDFYSELDRRNKN